MVILGLVVELGFSEGILVNFNYVLPWKFIFYILGLIFILGLTTHSYFYSNYKQFSIRNDQKIHFSILGSYCNFGPYFGSLGINLCCYKNFLKQITSA